MLAVSTPFSVIAGVGIAVRDGVGKGVSPKWMMRAVGVSAADGSGVTVGRRSNTGEGAGIFAVVVQPARKMSKVMMNAQGCSEVGEELR
jgi:hypothetical protein